MKINIKWLCSKDACPDGIIWFEGQKETEAAKIVHALMPDRYEWANWLVTRCLTPDQNGSYAVNAAELVLPLYEEKHPGSDAPRNAINAARAVLACDTPTTRAAAKAADSAADSAVYGAASAVARAAARAAASAADSAADFYAASDAYFSASVKEKIIKFGLELMEVKGE